MPEVFQSERFFREAWPQISHAFDSTVDAATEVQWVAGITGLEPVQLDRLLLRRRGLPGGGRVLARPEDAPRLVLVAWK